MMKQHGSVVLVTGASGFLGQHVVKMLQTRADHVQEIQVLDVVPYTNKLDYKQQKPVHITTGSITDPELLYEVCRGVDCVMHLASYIDVSMFPNEEKSYKINVDGTRNIIEACHRCNVPRLIYCSSIEVVRGTYHIYNGTESNTASPDHFLFEAYGNTKKQAEDLVIQANCSTLRTLCLRPTGMYGELERLFSPNLVNSCLGRKTNYFITLNCGKGQEDHCYVGNCAWAFVCADQSLQGSRSKLAAGNAYFIGDNTPHSNIADLIIQIGEQAGLKHFPLQIPAWLLAFVFSLLYHILNMVNVVYSVNLPFCAGTFYNLEKIHHFNYDKAKHLLDYHPIYNFQETIRLTANYLREMKNEKQYFKS